MKITSDEVIHVAQLARLDLPDNEVEPMTEQLDRILTFVAKLEELDTKGIEPTTHALAIHNAFRPDKVSPSLDQQEALANGPLTNNEAFVVPRVI